MENFKLPKNISLVPANPSQIPNDGVLLSEAQALLNASHLWPVGKTYEGTKTHLYRADTRDTRKTSQSWHCLVTEIHKDELSFSKVWSKLGHNKVWNQQSYLTKISKVTRIKYLSETQSIWTTLVTYPPPMSPRVFTVFQASWLLEHSHLRRGIVVTLPIVLGSKSSEDLSVIEERGVRGLFVSVEHVQEMDANTIEWRRVISVDPGGFFPLRFWAGRGMPKRLAEENALCIDWLKSFKPEETSKGNSHKELPQEGITRTLKPQVRRDSEEEFFHYQDGDTNTESIAD